MAAPSFLSGSGRQPLPLQGPLSRRAKPAAAPAHNRWDTLRPASLTSTYPVGPPPQTHRSPEVPTELGIRSGEICSHHLTEQFAGPHGVRHTQPLWCSAPLRISGRGRYGLVREGLSHWPGDESLRLPGADSELPWRVNTSIKRNVRIRTLICRRPSRRCGCGSSTAQSAPSGIDVPPPEHVGGPSDAKRHRGPRSRPLRMQGRALGCSFYK